MTIDLRQLRADLIADSIPSNLLPNGPIEYLIVYANGMRLSVSDQGKLFIDSQNYRANDVFFAAIRVITRHLTEAER